ncbi:MAG TPA: hypothetical protein VGM05_00430 [Planctomycetaceae bacterium]|jgi:hypothetical protein
MKLTRRVSVWNSFVRYGRSAVSAALLVAGMTAVSQAHNHGTWYLPAGHYSHPSPSPISNPSPPSGGSTSPASPVPEIDAGAAVGGLALLVGMVMLLRDRALAR